MTAGVSADILETAQVLVGAFFLFLAELDFPFVPLPFPGRCGMQEPVGFAEPVPKDRKVPGRASGPGVHAIAFSIAPHFRLDSSVYLFPIILPPGLSGP